MQFFSILLVLTSVGQLNDTDPDYLMFARGNEYLYLESGGNRTHFEAAAASLEQQGFVQRKQLPYFDWLCKVMEHTHEHAQSVVVKCFAEQQPTVITNPF